MGGGRLWQFGNVELALLLTKKDVRYITRVCSRYDAGWHGVTVRVVKYVIFVSDDDDDSDDDNDVQMLFFTSCEWETYCRELP